MVQTLEIVYTYAEEKNNYTAFTEFPLVSANMIALEVIATFSPIAINTSNVSCTYNTDGYVITMNKNIYKRHGATERKV